MAGNTIGTFLRLTTFGESHGPGIGGVLDGMPPQVKIDEVFLQEQIHRRASGRNVFSSSRTEPDQVEFLSGIVDGITTGTPIAFLVRNNDQRSADYAHLKDVFRSGHADITYFLKYGIRDHRGGGRASARETLNWVIGGSLVTSWLKTKGIQINGFVTGIGGLRLKTEPEEVSRAQILASGLSCPNDELTIQMEELLIQTQAEGDTLGGIITVVIDGLPAGLGEPVFDKFNADLAKACMSLNAVKGIEIGEGFRSASMRGSEFKDQFTGMNNEGMPVFQSNRSGGVLGGITTGQQLRFTVAFRPISSTRKESNVMRHSGHIEELRIEGRHDVCPVPRAVPILESLAALVTADHLLRFLAYNALP